MELLVLSRLLRVPIYVYQSAEEAKADEWGFIPIVKYGEAYAPPADAPPPPGAREPVHLLYTGGNHYDLLLR